MAKGGRFTRNAAIVLLLILAFCGFGVLLGGVAAVQQDCGNVNQNNIQQIWQIHYLAPVSCDKLFRYTWWILFFHFFVWLLVLGFFLSGSIHKIRAGLIGLLAAVTVLLMDTANTYLYFNSAGFAGQGSDTFRTRARVVTAGAIICAVVDGLLILAVGWHNERKHVVEGRKETAAGYGYATETRTGTTPVATGVTSTTAAAPVSAV